MVGPFCLPSFGSGFRVQGRGGGFAAFFIGRCPKVAFKSPVTSRSYDTREGIVSHAWYEILRLSPHLFWLRLFSHRAFSSAQDDDTRGRKGSHLRDTLRVLELSVLYTIRVAPYYENLSRVKNGAKCTPFIILY